MSITGVYWVLPGFYWVLPGFTGFYRVLPSFRELAVFRRGFLFRFSSSSTNSTTNWAFRRSAAADRVFFFAFPISISFLLLSHEFCCWFFSLPSRLIVSPMRPYLIGFTGFFPGCLSLRTDILRWNILSQSCGWIRPSFYRVLPGFYCSCVKSLRRFSCEIESGRIISTCFLFVFASLIFVWPLRSPWQRWRPHPKKTR